MTLPPLGMQKDNQVFSPGGVLFFKLVELYGGWVIVSGVDPIFFQPRKKRYSYA
jgi:hypothetical protein